MKAGFAAPNAQAASIPPSRRRSAVVIPVGVACATLLLILWSAWPMIRPARAVSVAQAIPVPLSVDTSPNQSTEGDAPPTGGKQVQAAGWLEAEPFSIPCVALADGVLESVTSLEGDRVEEGQVVATLVSRDAELRLRRAEAAHASAEAERLSAEAEARAAQVLWEQPIELERAVASTSAALKESRAELDQLPAMLESARATLERLEQELTRVQTSRSGNAATELELIGAQQRAIGQRAEVAALEGRKPLLEARIERLAAEARAAERTLALRIDDRLRLERAKAEVQRSVAAVESAATARDEAALELERMTIRSPITGYVQRRLKGPGDKVVRMMDDPSSAHVLHVYDPARLQVRVDVPLADAGSILAGQRCEIVVEILPDRKFTGRVLRVTHEADLQKNTLQIKVAVDEPSPLLRPEMLTRVTFLAGTGSVGSSSAKTSGSASRVKIPEACLDERDGDSSVWLVTDRSHGRGVLNPVIVSAIQRAEGWVTVEGAIQPGSLVASPADGMRRGLLVRFEADATKGSQQP